MEGRTHMKIILADGSVIECESVTLEPHFAIGCPDRAAFLSVWDRLTPENLDQIEIFNDSAFVAAFNACELVGTQTVNNYDGSMIGHFYLIGEPMAKTDPDYQTAYTIMTGETLA